MGSKITEYGRGWVVDRVLNGDGAPEQETIAVGLGTTEPTEEDDMLENEVYSASVTEANVNIYDVADAPGIYRASIEVTGGVEVPEGSALTEFGILTGSGDLIYREVRTETVVAAGERISFEFEINFQNL